MDLKVVESFNEVMSWFHAAQYLSYHCCWSKLFAWFKFSQKKNQHDKGSQNVMTDQIVILSKHD